MSNLADIPLDDLISELKIRGEQPNLSECSDEDLEEECRFRGIELAEDEEGVKDFDYLAKAIDYARWGNVGLCGSYLISAIPGLWPLRKVFGA